MDHLLLLHMLCVLIDDGHAGLAKQLAGQMDRDEIGLVPAVANWVLDPGEPLAGDLTIQSLVEDTRQWLAQQPAPAAGSPSPSGGSLAS